MSSLVNHRGRAVRPRKSLAGSDLLSLPASGRLCLGRSGAGFFLLDGVNSSRRSLPPARLCRLRSASAKRNSDSLAYEPAVRRSLPVRIPFRQSRPLAKPDLLSCLANARLALPESGFGGNRVLVDGRLWLTSLSRLRSSEPRSAQPRLTRPSVVEPNTRVRRPSCRFRRASAKRALAEAHPQRFE